MNLLVLILTFSVLLGVSIVRAESSEVKDVRSLIGKLSRENHLSRSSCNCEAKGLYRPKLAYRAQPMCEEERRQHLYEAIERFKQFLALFGQVDNFLAQKTTSLLKMVGKTVESDLEEDEEAQKQSHRKNVRKFWPYAYSPPPPSVDYTTEIILT